MINFNDITKRYDSLQAIDHLNLQINKGEFFGLLGPNGAGKTTLIRILSTLTSPTTGNITIDGIPMDRDKINIKSKIGIVSQHLNLEMELTARENLLLHGKLYNMKKDEMDKRMTELLHFIDLFDRKDEVVKKFSGGMKRKLMIARALMHQPEILLLDEPTVGLDAAVRRKLWDLMKGLNKDGLTVILTTHYIEEAENLCGRVAFLNKGKIVALDTPKNLINKSGNFVLEVYKEKEGITNRFFFNNRQAAIEYAKSVEGSINIRMANLEDTFVMLTNRKVGE